MISFLRTIRNKARQLQGVFRKSAALTEDSVPSWSEKYSVGAHTYGRPSVLEWGEKSNLTIGRYCSIAEGVTILLGGEHRLDWISTFPFSEFFEEHRSVSGHPRSKGDVAIGNDVWIGTDAMILSGVRIGDGAVIGARALVTKDVAPYSINGGNPSRQIRLRFPAEEIAHLLRMSWWNWPDDVVIKAAPMLMSADINGLRHFWEQTCQSKTQHS